MVETLYQVIMSRFEIKAYDILVIGTVVRGVLKEPDMVTDDGFEKIIEMIV